MSKRKFAELKAVPEPSHFHKKGKSMDLKNKFESIKPFMSNPFHYVSDKLINNRLIAKNKYVKATLKTLRGYESRDMLNILNESIQNYDPVGASTMTLMSDIAGGKWENTSANTTASVKMHLDKSHITTHTYPDASDPEGICTFRVDIDVATCGEIIPLRALEYMFNAFECDVAYIDYVVRGYTRLDNGKKIYNDHYFNSIQEFIPKDVLDRYVYRQDINMAHDNTWQTKLMIKEMGPENYLLDPKDVNHPDIDAKMSLLRQEMREVFHLN
jgi:S-adenosylmethionine decarboxylase